MKTLALLAAIAALAFAAHADERRITKEVIVAAPVEAVWKAWTTSEGIATFFAPEAKVDARPDGDFHIYMNPYAPPGLKGADDMRVMAVQENKLISFSWNAPPHLAEARAQRTFVTVRLQPEGTATRVQINHSGWGDGGQWDQAYTYFDSAWGRVLANLQKRFVERKPIDWTPWIERLKAQAEKQTTVKP